MSRCVAIIGSQWGDEGKGKIVDLLSQEAEYVVRFQGGHNAGHTIIFRDQEIKLHLIPSGILHSGVRCLIGNGVVVSPQALVDEIHMLEPLGVDVRSRLSVSITCPLILPYHVSLDQAREKKKGLSAIGTTGRGIGPAYEDKVARRAIRVIDLLSPEVFRQKLRENVDYYNFLFQAYYAVEPVNESQIYDETMRLAETFLSQATDVSALLARVAKTSAHVLFEGAQGAWLDVDHGTYPFVTSSNTTIGGLSTGAGFPARSIHHVLGVVKAYTTRVGAGPFPAELHDADGQWLSEKGREIGATTGRKRRCGWLDVGLIKKMQEINGYDGLAMTKLDVLDGLDKVKIAVKYRLGSRELETPPPDVETLQSCEPIYEEHPGWKQSTAGLTRYDELPPEAIQYLKRIETLIGVPITLISTGPKREDIITLQSPWSG